MHKMEKPQLVETVETSVEDADDVFVHSVLDSDRNFHDDVIIRTPGHCCVIADEHILDCHCNIH